MPTTQDVIDWKGQKLVDNDGDKIGTIEEIYLDEHDRQARSGSPSAPACSARKRQLRPDRRGPARRGPHPRPVRPRTRSRTRRTPTPTARLSQDEEARLYPHYGLDYSESRSDSGLPDGSTDRGRGTGADTDGAARRPRHVAARRPTTP